MNLLLVLSFLLIAACGSAPPEQASAVRVAEDPESPLVCVEFANGCRDARCWSLQTCNRAPRAGEELTNICQPVGRTEDGQYFCDWKADGT